MFLRFSLILCDFHCVCFIIYRIFLVFTKKYVIMFDFLRLSLIFFDLFQIDSQNIVSRVTERESPFD